LNNARIYILKLDVKKAPVVETIDGVIDDKLLQGAAPGSGNLEGGNLLPCFEGRKKVNIHHMHVYNKWMNKYPDE
jgi:hypothetical protein